MLIQKVMFAINLRRDPIPVPEKVRKPLTEVQGFDLHVDHRAVDRADFDKKVTFYLFLLYYSNKQFALNNTCVNLFTY